MAISTELKYAKLRELSLDPMNPRLGRRRMSRETPQDSLLEMMQAWVLDELANSHIESGGSWTHEPLIAVQEELYGTQGLVVVEGNRRLAALKLLNAAFDGRPVSPKWAEAVSGARSQKAYSTMSLMFSPTRVPTYKHFLGFDTSPALSNGTPTRKRLSWCR